MRKRKFASAESVNDVYIVETICKKKIRSNKEPLYFIKWKDWDDKYNTWEPLSNILDKSLIDIFEEEQKEKQKSKKENAKAHHELCQEPKEAELKTVDDGKRETIHEGGGDETMERCGIEDKSDKCFTETETRPKIYLKISKHRIHAPTMDVTKGGQDNDFVDHGMERVRKCSNVEEEWPFCNKVSPTYFSKDESLHRPITNSNHIRLERAPSSNKSSHFLDKHSQIHCDKTLTTSDFIIRKPRKLLSINEYSAKMKKRHKKSKQDKLKMEDKKSLHFSSHKHRDEVNVENKMERKPESKVVRPQHERPLVALENHIESWSEKPLSKDMMESVAAIKAVKQPPITERFKYHANTIVTDVTVKNLSVTIREMPYEDFIDSETSRYLMIRVPVQSDWMKRYHGSLKETKQKQTMESSQIQEVGKRDDKKPKRLDRLNDTGTLMTNFRRPSRPRSVDSYRTSRDKNYSTLFFKNPFTTTNSPVKTSSKLCPENVNNGTVLNCANEPHTDSGNSNPNANKSPLHICIEDCDEVDVVGGIESDHSFVGSLQAETVTMSTTQIRESMNPINTSSVTSIIQSLLQSYSYNSMMMPPLQTAPWMESHLAPTNHHHHHHQHHHQLYHIAHHNSNTNNGSNRSSKRNRNGTRNRNQRNHCGDNSEGNNDNVDDDDDDNEGDDYDGFENHDVHQLLCSSNNNNNNCLPPCSASVQPTNMLKFTENSNILYGQAAAAAAAVGFLSDIYINNATNPTTTAAATSQDGPIDLSLK